MSQIYLKSQEKVGSLTSFPTRINFWMQALEEWRQLVSSMDSQLSTLLQSVQHNCLQPQVTLTFGGHFKSGKSTVLNAMLGQKLLPTDDFPETGAICVLTSGQENAAEVFLAQGEHRVECNTTAIRREIALTSQVGERRSIVNNVKQLDIKIKGDVIPALVRWIDSPGINDTPTMDDCALRAAKLADVLVWVLSSRQCLSEPEQEFLASYIEERGPASVIFVLNSFLRRDTSEHWKRFLNGELPRLLTRIQSYAPDIGFTTDWPAQVIPIAGRASCELTSGHFGGSELHRFLLAFGSSDNPRVQVTRLFYARYELRKLVLKTQEKLQHEQTRLETEQQAFAHKRQKVERRRQEFVREVERSVNAFFIDWPQRAHDCGESVAWTVDSNSLKRDDTYSQKLTESLRDAARLLANNMLEKVAKAVKELRQSPLKSSGESTVREKLTPSKVSVKVANNDVGVGGSIGGGVIGAAIGSAIFPGVGTWIGVALGSAIGGGSSASEAMERDVNDTKLNVRKAAQSAANSLQGKRSEVVNLIINYCATDSNLSGISKPDETSVKFWESLYTKILHLVQETEEMAKELTS
nr:dynamin family protein [uncultured Desulfobacter sp.]